MNTRTARRHVAVLLGKLTNSDLSSRSEDDAVRALYRESSMRASAANTIDRTLRDVEELVVNLRADAMDETEYRKLEMRIRVARRLLARLVK